MMKVEQFREYINDIAIFIPQSTVSVGFVNGSHRIRFHSKNCTLEIREGGKVNLTFVTEIDAIDVAEAFRALHSKLKRVETGEENI